MKMIRAIVRPDRQYEVIRHLETAGFTSMTKMDVAGRGRQGGLRVAGQVYDELPKVMIMLVVQEGRVESAMDAIRKGAHTGSIGDGKIFVSDVEEAMTISSGKAEL